MELDIFQSYNYNNEYHCTPDLKTTQNSKLMFLLIMSRTIPKDTIKNYISQHPEEAKETNSEGWNALHFVARNSQLLNITDLMIPILECGVKVDAQTNDGSTALMLAAGHSNSDSNAETIRLLLLYGANVNIQNDNGWTALMFSVYNSDEKSDSKTVKILLDNGALIDARNNEGSTPLILACQKQNPNMKTIEILLDYGAYHYDEDNNGKMPYHYLAKNGIDNLILFMDKVALLYHYKKCMDNIINVKRNDYAPSIPSHAQKFVLRNGSIRIKLMNIKWKMANGNVEDLMSDRYKDIREYLSVPNDYEIFYQKVMDMINYME